MTRLNDCCFVCRRFSYNAVYKKVHKRNVLALERTPVQSTLGIESEHFVHEPNDRTRCSVTNFYDCVHHTYSLPRKARQSVMFLVIEHA